jgi:hypothetical protein
MIPLAAHGIDVCLLTANDALLRPGKEADFFQPTVDGSVESGMHGCVRNHGHRLHEGIDIKCLQPTVAGNPPIRFTRCPMAKSRSSTPSPASRTMAAT